MLSFGNGIAENKGGLRVLTYESGNDIQTVCSKHSYRILLCITESGSKNEVEYLDMLENMRADGTILLCPTTRMKDISKYDRQAIISVDAVINDKIPNVCSDFYKGGYLAANKLVENGCKNILHISAHNYYYANEQRHMGFETGIKEHLNSIQSYQIEGTSIFKECSILSTIKAILNLIFLKKLCNGI
ncbi:MAG: hypothetical protein HFH11_05365 [Dorea sp.]|jgi:DNA-binding LacI/PurR family transcriptional regulator|nr:hypothetical protein [Dorea sp.]